MGADFIEPKKKTFRRSWDRELVALGTADLFRREPECGGASVVGEIIGDAKLSPGEKLTVEKGAGGLIARRGLSEVVRIPDAPPDVIRGIEQSCGVGVGTVDHVHDPAGVVEIRIC